MTGWPVWLLCQMAAVRARTRWTTRAITPPGVWPPWRSRSSWPLKVSLTDSMIWRSALKNCVPGRSGSPWRAGRKQGRVGAGQGGLEVTAVVVLVADEDLAGQQGGQAGVCGQQGQQHLALVGLGAGQGETDGQAVQGAQQVQAQSPEVAGVAGAVPVLGPSGQVRAADGLLGPAALDRGGIDHPHVIGPQAGVAGQDPISHSIVPASLRSRLL